MSSDPDRQQAASHHARKACHRSNRQIDSAGEHGERHSNGEDGTDRHMLGQDRQIICGQEAGCQNEKRQQKNAEHEDCAQLQKKQDNARKPARTAIAHATSMVGLAAAKSASSVASATANSATNLPWVITRMRSDSTWASSISDVANKTVRPPAARERNVR